MRFIRTIFVVREKRRDFQVAFPCTCLPNRPQGVRGCDVSCPDILMCVTKRAYPESEAEIEQSPCLRSRRRGSASGSIDKSPFPDPLAAPFPDHNIANA